MNKKDISEIKKLLTPAKNSITRITGCYVGADGDKITSFAQNFLQLPDEEIYKYFEIFRKMLSGTVGKNLLNMAFPMEQEEEGGTAAFLRALRDSELNDDELLEEFYDKVIDNYLTDDNFLILLIHNTYDVPGRTSDNLALDDASDEVYDYIQCAICSVELAKPALSYSPLEKAFKNRERDWIVGVPQLGFLFPAFNDRQSDIHEVLYYSKNTEDLHIDLTDHLLGCEIPLTASSQKDAFEAVVEQTLGDGCDFDTVKAIHDNLAELQQDAKAQDSPDPVTLDKLTMRNLLERSGAQEEQMSAFEDSFTQNAGEKGSFYAENVNSRKFEVHTPDVTVSVSPDRTDLVETRTIDGRECLVIPITDEVKVNGITIRHRKKAAPVKTVTVPDEEKAEEAGAPFEES